MGARLGWALLVMALSALGSASVSGQEFAVSTRVRDMSPLKPGEKSLRKPGDEVARSETLFHAGKVYDFLDGEITIFEPAQERFIFISHSRKIVAILPFADIESRVSRLEQLAANRKQTLAEGDAKSRERAGPIEFQLHPVFQPSFDAAARHLKLSSAFLTYDVKCEEKSPEIVATYLRYADWAARLNLVTQGQILPNPRLALNAALKERRVLPVKVELQSHQTNPLHLQADHRFEWKLTTHDRQQIYFWEQQLRDSKLQRVTFDRFQQATQTKLMADR